MTVHEQTDPAGVGEIEQCVRAIVKCVHPAGPLQLDLLMQDVHWMWQLVCGKPHGHSLYALADAADEFRAAGSKVAKESGWPPALEVGEMGADLASLRRGEFSKAAAGFAPIRLDGPATVVLRIVTRSWQSYCLALGREHETAAEAIKDAKDLLKKVSERGVILPGVVALSEALLDFECGRFSAASELLDQHLTGLGPPFRLDPSPFPCFLAEALLLKAKLQREQGRYESAAREARQANHLRNSINDLLGKAWGWVEMARCSRFRGDYESALQELGESEALLEDTGFNNWQARVQDQRGDVYRAMDKPDIAQKCYQRAAGLANMKERPRDEFLVAHISNSLARLQEDCGNYKGALNLITPTETTWRGKKEYGKHLYLLGSLQWRLDNWGEAEELLLRSCAEFRHYGMRTHESLALDRLAQLYTDSRRQVTPALRQKACGCWAEALRVASLTETDAILNRIRQNACRMTAEDLLGVVSGLSDELNLLRKDAAERASREEQGRRSLFLERYCVSHWLARPLRWHLDGDQRWQHLPEAVRVLCSLIEADDRFNWVGQDFSRSPARPIEAVEVFGSLKECCEAASRAVHAELSVELPDRPYEVWVQKRCFDEAFTSLFRACWLAFRARSFRLTVSGEGGTDGHILLRLAPVMPEPQEFEFAERLRHLEDAWPAPSCRRFFENGYGGEWAVVWYLLEVGLWGRITFDLGTQSIVISLPGRQEAAFSGSPPAGGAEIGPPPDGTGPEGRQEKETP